MEPLKSIAKRTQWYDETAFQKLCETRHALYAKSMGGKSVLEVGSGPGGFSAEAVGLYGATSYAGLDVSVGMVRDARRFLPGHFFVAAAANALPFMDQSFDVVYAAHLIHHVPLDVRPAVAREFQRVARRFVVIEEPYGFRQGLLRSLYAAYYRIADGSYYRYTLKEWQDAVHSWGFKIVEQCNTGEDTIVHRLGIWVLKA
jgi:ubiquinone/menaquinone biosynthesis C-methylase UbiE